MTDDPHTGVGLRTGMVGVDITYPELWQRYAALGGNASQRTLQDYVAESDSATRRPLSDDDHEHNLIAQALNDTYTEQGGDHPVAYQHLYRNSGPDPVPD